MMHRLLPLAAAASLAAAPLCAQMVRNLAVNWQPENPTARDEITFTVEWEFSDTGYEHTRSSASPGDGSVALDSRWNQLEGGADMIWPQAEDFAVEPLEAGDYTVTATVWVQL